MERHGRGTGFASSSGEILHSWRGAGYTHLLFHKSGADFVYREDRQHYEEADWEALDELLDGLETLQDFGGAYQLYRLNP